MEQGFANSELKDDIAVVVHEDPAFLRASELSSLYVVPLALKAAINLRVMDILNITAAHPHGYSDPTDVNGRRALSATEIVSVMSSLYGLKGASVAALERVLRLLASHGVLDVIDDHQQEPAANGSISLLSPKYALNSVSKYFVTHADGGGGVEEGVTKSMPCQPSYSSKDAIEGENDAPVMRKTFAPVTTWQLHKANLESWHHVEESILDDSMDPFTRANGKSMYLYSKEDDIFGKKFNLSMACLSKGLLASFLEAYQGFSSMNSLVDVGGGLGSCLQSIVAKYPHIKGINFDQPHVVANACHIEGVTHVGGNIFEGIPKAEAILLKSVLHNWSDKDSIKILDRCYEALPHGGKVIILENVLPSKVGPGHLASRVAYHIDVIMFLRHHRGRERTHDEIQSLAQASGFSSAKLVCKINDICVLEIHKT